jgi:hypothetical protein
MQASRWLEAVKPTTPNRNWRKPIAEELEFMGVRFTFSRPEGTDFPPSVAHAIDRLVEFSALGPNWDSYGGQPLQKGAVRTCLSVMFASHESSCIEPRLYPIKSGGVGMVWTAGDAELEVQVSPNGELDAAYEDSDGHEVELPLGSSAGDLAPLFELLRAHA